MVGKAARTYFFIDPFQRKLSKKTSSKRPHGKVSSDRKTICVIRPNNSKEVSQMAQGVVGAFMDFVEYPHIIPVVGDNNVMELTALLHSVVRQHPNIDMILSLGASSTKIAQKVTQAFGNKIPVFFIAVDETLAPDIMQLGNNVTGVVNPTRDYVDQFKRFFYFTQPNTIKKVLLPCSRFANGFGSAYNNEVSSDLISFFALHRIEAKVIEVTCREELHTKVKPLLSNVTLLAIPRDVVLEAYIGELIEMANERQVPSFSSSVETVEQGVAVGFGLYSSINFAKQRTSLAKSILMGGVHPSQFPMVRINEWASMMAINRAAATQQGLKLDMGRVCADNNVILLL